MARPGESLLDRLRREVVLWDGGMGTSLMDRGLAPGDPPERWNLERPDEVRAVHRAFFEAGTGLVRTNTFGGNRVRLAVFGLEGELEPINRSGVEIAFSASPKGVVAGDIGPTGAKAGDLDARRMEEVYAEQASILATAGVHLIHADTMPGRAESVAALRGAKSVASLPVIVSITLQRQGDSFRTLAGDDPAAVWEALEEEGADAVGANCMLAGPEMVEAVRRYRPGIRLPFVALPVGGPALLESMKALVQAGVNGVGGCCGTPPSSIRDGRLLLGSMATEN